MADYNIRLKLVDVAVQAMTVTSDEIGWPSEMRRYLLRVDQPDSWLLGSIYVLST
jgi:hypothetical protein